MSETYLTFREKSIFLDSFNAPLKGSVNGDYHESGFYLLLIGENLMRVRDIEYQGKAWPPRIKGTVKIRY